MATSTKMKPFAFVMMLAVRELYCDLAPRNGYNRDKYNCIGLQIAFYHRYPKKVSICEFDNKVYYYAFLSMF